MLLTATPFIAGGAIERSEGAGAGLGETRRNGLFDEKLILFVVGTGRRSTVTMDVSVIKCLAAGLAGRDCCIAAMMRTVRVRDCSPRRQRCCWRCGRKRKKVDTHCGAEDSCPAET